MATRHHSRRKTLTVAEYALLGLITLRDPAPAHGYDLHRELIDSPLSDVIRMAPGMMYHYLRRLEANGLLDAAAADDPDHPSRQQYTVSGEGRREFQTWLTAPVRATREIRIDFLVKYWFARAMAPATVSELIDAQLAAVRAWEASLLSQRDMAPDSFTADILDLRRGQNAAVRVWLEQLEDS